MATEIEQHLFGNNGTHCLISFRLRKDQLGLKIAPWAVSTNVKVFLFEKIEVESIETLEEEKPPFDIIGMNCSKIDADKWIFCIHCSEREYVFKGKWPTTPDDLIK